MTPEASNLAAAVRLPRRRAWVGLASVAASAALVLLCVYCVDARQVQAQLSATDLRWLGAFFLVYLLQIVLLGLRWSTLSRQLGIPLRWRRASAEYALSVLVNNVLPTGFAGDGWRAIRHAQRCPGHGLPRILEALALDRASGQVALLMTVGAGLPLIVEAGLVRPSSLLIGAFALAGGGLALARWARQGDRASLLVTAARGFLRRAGALLFRPSQAATHLPLSLLLTGTLLVQLWFSARAAGIDLDWQRLTWLGPLIVLAASAPSFFGSWGVREGASALLFAGAGLPSSTGVTLSLLFGCFSLVSALPGAAVLLFDGGLPSLEDATTPALGEETDSGFAS